VNYVTLVGAHRVYACAEHFLEIEDKQMSTRRKVYWWFWFVASGRFLSTFLNVQS
jgi:hypothetical protein